MSDDTIKQRALDQPRPWRSGDVIEARRLQEPLDAIESLRAGIDAPRQVPLNGDATRRAAVSYAGPFAGSIGASAADKRTIFIGHRRSDALVRDTITIGIDRLEKTAPESIELTSTGLVYYTITKSGTTISATLATGEDMPDDDATTLYIVLGKAIVNASTGTIQSWRQYQYGQIFMQAALIDAEDCEGETGGITDAEIKTAYENNADTNAYTDAEKTKLAGIDANANNLTDHGALTGLGDDDHAQYLLVSGTRAMTGNLNMGSQAITSVGNVDGRDVSADGSTLDSHVANTSNPHSVTAAQLSALQNVIEDTTPQLGGDLDCQSNNITSVGNVDGRDVSADGTKLDGIEASANNYSHPNHTGDVTSTGDGATVVASVAITGQTEKTSMVGDDKVLISDSADSNSLKYVSGSTILSYTKTDPFAAISDCRGIGGLYPYGSDSALAEVGILTGTTISANSTAMAYGADGSAFTIQTSAVANNDAYIEQRTGTSGFFRRDNGIKFAVKVQLSSASRITLFAGFTEATTLTMLGTSPIADFAGFRLDDDASEQNWDVFTSNASTSTKTDTSVTAGLSSPDAFILVGELNGSAMEWEILDPDLVSLGSGSVTATLPGATEDMDFIVAIRTETNNSRSVNIHRAMVAVKY
jgi:hypothetical protein